MSILDRIKIWFESQRDIIPLSIILTTSPLPPLTTLNKVRELGFYKYLPKGTNPILKEYSKKFREFYREIAEAHISGSEKRVEYFLEDKLEEFKSFAETGELRVLSNIAMLNSIAVILPPMISVLMVLTNPLSTPLLLIGLSILSIVLILLLNLPNVTSLYSIKFKKAYLTLLILLAIPLYFLTENPYLALLVPSIPLSIVSFIELKKELNERENLLSIVKSAATGVNIFKYYKLNPEKFVKKYYGFMKGVAVALYLGYAFGSGEKMEALLKYYRIYLNTLKRIRLKTFTVIFYSFLMVSAAVSVLYLMEGSLREFRARTPDIPATFNFIQLPSLSQLNELEKYLDIAVVINITAFALSCAMLREGNPLYFTIYLPLLLTIAVISKYITLTYFLPLLIR